MAKIRSGFVSNSSSSSFIIEFTDKSIVDKFENEFENEKENNEDMNWDCMPYMEIFNTTNGTNLACITCSDHASYIYKLIDKYDSIEFLKTVNDM